MRANKIPKSQKVNKRCWIEVHEREKDPRMREKYKVVVWVEESESALKNLDCKSRFPIFKICINKMKI